MLTYNDNNIYQAICTAIAANNEHKPISVISKIVKNCLERNNILPVKIYCESPDYDVPKYSHPGEDTCMDLIAQWIETKFDRIIYHTGIHIELPKNYQLNIYPRSSITKCGWYIPNSPGIVDSGYRGEILVVFRHPQGLYREDFPFKEGDRIAQCQVVAYQEVQWKRVVALEDLEPSNRGDGGYGSTGK